MRSPLRRTFQATWPACSPSAKTAPTAPTGKRASGPGPAYSPPQHVDTDERDDRPDDGPQRHPAHHAATHQVEPLQRPHQADEDQQDAEDQEEPLTHAVHPAAARRTVRSTTRSETGYRRFPVSTQWWRDAVIYQIYPRSFADSDGDGLGDLPGITSRLEHLVELGADAVWLSPFYPSPHADAGYDVADYRDVDPIFGKLADFDALLARAHQLGLRVIVDLVPNHTSDEHPWFKAAVAAGPGSRERERYVFRDEPNDWESVFGGSAWSQVADGQWYLHLFDVRQPDLNWDNPEVREEFENVLRFWLDRPPRSTRMSARRCGTRRASTRSTVPGARSRTGTRESGSWLPRRGSTRWNGWPVTFARTRCTRRSTSRSCSARGLPARSAR